MGKLVVALVGEDDGALFDLCDRNAGDCGHVLQLEFLRGRARASGHPGGDEDSGTVESHGRQCSIQPPPEIIGIDSERRSREAGLVIEIYAAGGGFTPSKTASRERKSQTGCATT